MATNVLSFPAGLGPGLRKWARLSGGAYSDSESGSEEPEEPTDPELCLELERKLFEKLLRGGGSWLQFEAKPGVFRYLRAASGRIRASAKASGPGPSDVMVVGKCLGVDEQSVGRVFSGDTGERFLDECDAAGCSTANWYLTNVLKTTHPDDGNGWSKKWLAEWLGLLGAELAVVRPKYIACLGSEVLKTFVGNRESLKKSEGVVHEVSYPVGVDDAGQTIYETAMLMGITNPAALSHKPQLADQFQREVRRFCDLTNGVRWDLAEANLDHRVILDMSELLALEKEVARDCEDNLIAIDAEWEGAHPENAGSGLVSIQLSWKHGSAACIGLRTQGGAVRFRGGSIPDAMAVLLRIFEGRQLAGHFIVADLEWMEAEGLPITRMFAVPDSPEGLQDAIEKNLPCGIDTAYAMHAIEETADFSLKSMAIRLTTAPRYDKALKKWLEDERVRRSQSAAKIRREIRKIETARKKAIEAGLPPPDLEERVVAATRTLSEEEEEVGFGAIPDEIRDPYACLRRGSLVQLADGSWEKIDVLVKNRYSGLVKSLAADGRVVNSRVVGWHRAAVNQKEWFQIETVGAKYSRAGLMGPSLTPDHKVLTRRGMVQVQNLRPGEDSIATEELVFSDAQLSVFLGSLLGDGGFQRQNRSGVGFGFGQSLQRAAYADWKADVFAQFDPRPVAVPGARRYTLPFSRYLHSLSCRFPTHLRGVHRDRKVAITQDLLDSLGNLGLAVWYQDDGTLPRDRRTGDATSCRIYARKLAQSEIDLLLSWLSARFGEGVSYNVKGGFIQFAKTAFTAFQAAVLPFIHPAVAYKVLGRVDKLPRVRRASERFYDSIVAVVPCRPTVRRGTGVRYCLSVEGTRNFLTKVGFVSNCYDADVTRRIAVKMKANLAADQFGNPCWKPFWITMRALPAILEINRSGMYVFRERLDRLALTYVRRQEDLLKELRRVFRWDGDRPFNPDSAFEAREALFGEQFNGKSAVAGAPVRLRPPGAVSLYLTPTLTTGKRQMLWSDVVRQGLVGEKTPSAGRMALAILSHNPKVRRRNPKSGVVQVVDCSKPLGLFRDYKTIAQVLRSSIRRPVVCKDGSYKRRDDGWLSYLGGMPGAICDDGYVRTHIYPTKETGRWSSSRPPLHNISKRREADYKRVLGDQYPYPLRSMIGAEDGYLLIEADYIGAELFGMAVMACDEAMIRDVFRNQLPETDPDFYDIHSNIAVDAFRLPCAPTKAGLGSIEKAHLRDIAKAVIFGVAYGRQSKAIAVAAREQGVMISEEEAEAIRQAIFRRYPGLEPFFEECRRRASHERFIVGCLGRMRRAPYTDNQKLISDYEREFMNAPIQGLVADVVSRAVDYLQQVREEEAMSFKIVMQIHDAIVVKAPYREVERVVEYVLPEAMRRRVPIYPTTLSGAKTGLGPYHLGLDTNVYRYWGIQLYPEQLISVGVSPTVGQWHALPSGGWSHPNKAGKIWIAGGWRDV